MTQYLLSVHGTGNEAEEMTDEVMQSAYARVDVFNTELEEAGAWVFAGGLHPADTATVVASVGGEVMTTDGPYLESKEHLGGFWVIEAADLDAALAWASKATVACDNPVEVRPFQGE